MFQVLFEGLRRDPRRFATTRGSLAAPKEGSGPFLLANGGTSPGTSARRRLTVRAYATACALAIGMSAPTGAPIEEVWLLLPQPASNIAVVAMVSMVTMVRSIKEIIPGVL